MFSATSIPILQKVVAFTEARHELLAGNVANLDTPDYQVRDLSLDQFQENLRALAEAESAPRVQSQGYHDPAADVRERALHKVEESMKSILYHDGSNVGLEQQVAALSKNQMLHNVAISIMTSQFRMLQTAVSERV